MGTFLRTLVAGLAIAVSAFAQEQGVVFQSNAFTTVSVNGTSVLRPVPNAQVYICASNVTPCTSTNTLPVYSDVNLTVPISQPVLADKLGNFSFYGSAGQYHYTIYSPGSGPIATYPFTISSIGGDGVRPQPIVDQWCGDSTYCMVPTGDVGARATSLFASAFAAGKNLHIRLIGPGLAPLTANSIVVPVSNGTNYTFSCESEGGLQYNGTGAAIQEGRTNDSAVYTYNQVYGCNVTADFSVATAGVSTCTNGMGAGGLVIRDMVFGPSTGSSIPNGITFASLDICGNMVTGSIENITSIFAQDGIRFRGSVGSGYSSDANAWSVRNIKTLNSQRYGIALLGRPQSIGLYGLVLEGDGCGTGSNVVQPTNASVFIQGGQGISVDNYYFESSCGHQRLLIGDAAYTSNVLTGVRLGNGIMQDFPGQVDVEVVNCGGCTAGYFDSSGNASLQVHFAATVQGNGNRVIGLVFGLDAGAVAPQSIQNTFATCNYQGGNVQCDTSFFSFASGSCTVIRPTSYPGGYWRIVFQGELNSSGAGYYPSAGAVFTNASPTVSIPTGGTPVTLTASSNSSNQLCITASAATQFGGHYSVTSSQDAPTP